MYLASKTRAKHVTAWRFAYLVAFVPTLKACKGWTKNRGIKNLSRSPSKIWTHLIFSAKDHYPFVSEKSVREQLHAYLSSILRKQSEQKFSFP